MALTRSVRPEPPNGFIASAVRLPAVRQGAIGSYSGWQGRAWHHYDTLGEVRFIANWVGNMMSLAKLVPVKRVGAEYEVVESGPAKDAMDAYFGGKSGQSEMLQQTGIHSTVAGECYHMMLGDADMWTVLPCNGVTQGTDKKLTARIGDDRVKLSNKDLVIRVWTPHPVNSDQADSPLRSSMSTLEEIQNIDAHLSSQLKSRLTGAGILFMPSEIQFAVPPGVDPQSSQADMFMQVLGEVMSTGVKDQDRDSAASLVPIVVTAPGDVLDKVQHMTFWSPLDEAILSMREHAVKRLAIGMDTPPEILLGMGANTNHWASWLVDEASIKSHLEPRLAAVANAITTAYLRPALEDLEADPNLFSVMADTSQIRVRPNRSNEAIEAYDRGELSGRIMLREIGFNPEDAPDDAEKREWLLRKVATGSTSPEQTMAALRALGADLGSVSTDSPNQRPNDAQRTDSRRDAVDQRKPDIPRSVKEKQERDSEMSLVAACDVLVWRALERAGNRMCDAKARATGLGEVKPHLRYLEVGGLNVEKVLEGAWTGAEEVLDGFCADPAAVIASLDLYTRSLLATRTPHKREAVHSALTMAEGLSHV